MTAICQTRLPVLPWMDAMTARLPGLQPAAPTDWLRRDEVFARQMALRDELIATRLKDIYATAPGAAQAERLLLDAVVETVLANPDYRRDGETIVRPDGVAVSLSAHAPLVAAARLVQEDLLLLAPGAELHALVAGVACFPASWTLAEKIGRPLAAIHTPVALYDDGLARRVDRVIANLAPRRPVWRANALIYNTPELYHPRREADPRSYSPGGGAWVRIERQCLMRLADAPDSPTVFTIHTYVAPHETLTPTEAAALAEWLARGHSPPR